MKMKTRYLTGIILAVSLATSLRAAPPISDADYAALFSVCKPQTKELAWTKIPWGVDLWEARKQAAADGKPILLWEMDGHPLGCT